MEKQVTIKDIALQSGLSIFTVSRAFNDHPDIRIQTILNSMLLNRLAVIIISISLETKPAELFEQLLKHGVKKVFFDRVCEDLDVYCIEIDDELGAYRAVEYLSNKNYRKIIHLAGTLNLNVVQLDTNLIIRESA